MAERINMAEPGGQDQTPPGLIIARTMGEARTLAGQPNVPILGSEGQPARPSAEAPRPSEQTARQRVERPGMPDSDFKRVVRRIITLEQQAPSQERDQNLQEARQERDTILREANEDHHLLDYVKREDFELYYDSRVKVERDEKLGKGEYRGRGRMDQLRAVEDEAGVYSWEGNWVDRRNRTQGFWADPNRAGLYERYGGVADYVHEESLKMIRAVVAHRNMFNGDGLDEVREEYELMTDDEYLNNGLTRMDDDGYSVWNYNWHSDHERTYYLKNFDDIRDLVEHERRKKYFIPNRGDYESWIKLVADDVEEVEEDIPYILSVIKSKFGTGNPEDIYKEIDQERTKIQKALEKFGYDLGYEREFPEYRKFKRLQSKLAYEINLLGAYEFSNLVHEDWQPYLKFMATLARGFQDTEYQESIIDATYLDKDGLMAMALHLFEQNDGEFWRFGSNSADTPKYLKEGPAQAWQDRKREQIRDLLIHSELRPMQELLNLDGQGNPLAAGPIHPAFERLRAKLAALDQADTDAGRPLVDSYGKPMTRWQEYCEKALLWQRNQIFTEEIMVNGRRVVRRVYPIGDPQDRSQRVLFQHPLARELTDEEFTQMFRTIDENSPRFKRERSEKERKVRSITDSAERFARAFQEDAAAGLARHTISFARMREIGLIPGDIPLTNGNFNLDAKGYPIGANGQSIPREILHYAVDDGGMPIIVDANGRRIPRDAQGNLISRDGRLVPEAVPHKTLLKFLAQRAINQDHEGADNNPDKQKKMRFKLTYFLKKIGLHRSLPTFSNWYLGAHDSKRPDILEDIEAIPGFKSWLTDAIKVRSLDPDDDYGGDEKVKLTRANEDEREFVELLEVYIRDQFGSFFNFPGHDVKGGGNKEARNLFLLPYGQSRGTVELNSLIPAMWLGETDFLGAYGCSNWKEFIGLYKGSDEVSYQERGSFFETPRDAEYWVRRVQAIIDQQKLWISGSDKGPALLNGGWASGFFKWRSANRSASFVEEEQHKIRGDSGHLIEVGQFTTLIDPEAAYRQMDERTYEGYVQLAGAFVAPLEAVFEARQKLENVYGRSPGTAKFLNTLTWYAVSRWMDTNYEEYRGKFGNALDPNLHLARKFIHTMLFESRLIFSDEEWDQRVLGYTIPEAVWTRIQKGPFHDYGMNNKGLGLPSELAEQLMQRIKSGHPGMTDEQINAEIKRLQWSDLTDEERNNYKPIIKVTSYALNSEGETIAQENIEDLDGNIIVKKGEVVKGEQVVGILDAFPPDLRQKILERHNNKQGSPIIPMGLTSEFPETLGIIKQLKKRGEGSLMRGIYEILLSHEQYGKQTRQRKAVDRSNAFTTQTPAQGRRRWWDRLTA